MAPVRTERRGGRVAGVALAAAALVAAATPARAAEPGARGHAEVRVGFMRFDYEERDASGTFLDGEEGFVPSITGEAELRGDRVFGRALVRFAKGTVDYDGHVQSSDPSLDGLPVQTRSDASFLQGELQGGAFVDDARRVALFGALGARRWNRDIRETTVVAGGVPTTISGLSEVYTWYELQAGVRWTFLEGAGTSWDVDGRIVRTAGASISVDLTPFVGTATNVTMDLQPRTGWRLGSTFRQDFRPGTFVVVTGWAEGYSFGQSDVNPTYMILEPDSSTVNLGLEVGIGGRF